MKLELKHLASYLGTGLKCYGMGECTIESEGTDDEKPQLFQIEGMNGTWVEVSGRLETVTDEIHIEDCIPHLLPLSALTEPMENGGVPIVELAKIATFWNNKNQNYRINNERFSFGCISQSYEFWYCSDGAFNASKLIYKDDHFVKEEIITINNQLQLFEYLFANHFDVYGLIDAGLAIDKRTLK